MRTAVARSCLVMLASWSALAGPPTADLARLVDERVVVIADDRERAALVEAALRARGLRLVDDSERLGLEGAVERQPAGDRERMRASLLSARGAWRQLDLEAAATHVGEAVAETLRLERPEDHVDILVDALLFRASLALGRGSEDDARQDLVLASRLEPEREMLDAALHPPSVVQAFADARAASRAAEPAVVVVRPRVIGVGADSDVVVDGVRVEVRGGLVELQRGPHLVTVRAPGCRSVSRFLEVNGTDVAIEDVLVADDAIAARQARVAALRTGDRAALAGLREELGVDIVVALDVVGQVVAQRGVGAPVIVDVEARASASVVADAVLRAVAPVAVADEATDETPPTNALLWSLGAGGVVVIAGTAAVVTWLLWPGDTPPPPPRPVVLIAINL